MAADWKCVQHWLRPFQASDNLWAPARLQDETLTANAFANRRCVRGWDVQQTEDITSIFSRRSSDVSGGFCGEQRQLLVTGSGTSSSLRHERKRKLNLNRRKDATWRNIKTVYRYTGAAGCHLIAGSVVRSSSSKCSCLIIVWLVTQQLNQLFSCFSVCCFQSANVWQLD